MTDHKFDMKKTLKTPFGDIKLTMRHDCPPYMLVADNNGVWHYYKRVDNTWVELPWPHEDEE